ncbi:MAG: protein kinase [Paludibacteraceae bacterium]|nr:protein kinase [Paludibacteraceae bacterium]
MKRFIPTSTPITEDFEVSPNAFYDIEVLNATGRNIIYRAKKAGKWFVLKGVKTLEGSIARNEHLLKREFDLFNKLNSNEIVQCWTLERIDGIGLCIVMEYVDGRNLQEFLQEKPSKKLRRKVLYELLNAVDYIHHCQIVHQDLKPNNILITNNGTHVKIIDFGLSDNDAYYTNKNLGCTNGFAAPEQLQNDLTIDLRADIYALGKIIDTIFPNKYRSIKAKCCQHNREKRYQSVADIQKAIKQNDWLTHYGIALFLLFVLISSIIFVFTEELQHNKQTIAETKQSTSKLQQELDSMRTANAALQKLKDSIDIEKAKIVEGRIAFEKVKAKFEKTITQHENNIKNGHYKYREVCYKYFKKNLNEKIDYLGTFFYECLPQTIESQKEYETLYQLYYRENIGPKQIFLMYGDLPSYEEEYRNSRMSKEEYDALKKTLF